MAISMHSASAPIFVQMLRSLTGCLDKAEAHAQARNFPSANYLGLRLAPDMLPFSSQIQIASDNAKGCMARLAGVDNPKYEDKEASLEELRERLRKTIAFVESVPAAKVDGSEEREIVLRLPKTELRYRGEDYLRQFALPNFLFHCTTAYALLRAAGVPLGKTDFLGPR